MTTPRSSNPHVPYSQQFGSFLREKRLAKGYSQGELSVLLKYDTAQVISNWERGTQSPPFEKLVELCKFLDIPNAEMLNRLLNEQERIYRLNFDKHSEKTASKARKRA